MDPREATIFFCPSEEPNTDHAMAVIRAPLSKMVNGGFVVPQLSRGGKWFQCNPLMSKPGHKTFALIGPSYNTSLKMLDDIACHNLLGSDVSFKITENYGKFAAKREQQRRDDEQAAHERQVRREVIEEERRVAEAIKDEERQAVFRRNEEVRVFMAEANW